MELISICKIPEVVTACRFRDKIGNIKITGLHTALKLIRMIVPVWCVALILFKVRINADLLDSGFPFKLYVDEMRLRTVRLPVGFEREVPQLVDTKTWQPTHKRTSTSAS